MKYAVTHQQIFCLVIACLIVLSSPKAAGSSNLTQQEFRQLQQLQLQVRNQNFKLAWQLAQSMSVQFEGLSSFDFLYARAALENQEYDLATFALERVLIDTPNDYRAHLDMGRALFFSQHFNQAERHFDLVLAQSPPATVIAICNDYKKAISQQRKQADKQSQYQMALTFGYDSNINQGPTSANIDPKSNLLGLNQLDEQSIKTSDPYLQLSFNANQSWPISRFHILSQTARLSVKQGVDHKTSNQAQLAYEFSSQQQFERFSWLNQIKVSHTLLDYENSQSSLAFSSMLPFKLSTNNSLSAILQSNLNFSWLGLDNTFDNIGLKFNNNRASFKQQVSLTLGQFAYADQTQDHQTFQSAQIDYQIQRRLFTSLQQLVSVQAQIKQYQLIDPFFIDSTTQQNIIREDQTYNLISQSTWFASSQWQLVLNVAISIQRSNIDIYSNERIDVNLGIKRQF